MGRITFSPESYRSVADSVGKEGGSVTHRAEQRQKSGKGLHPLVDPSADGVIRYSRNRFEAVDDQWRMTVGQSMLLELRFDTTGSMDSNVQGAFDALPRTFGLLKEVSGAPLGRYDLQIINAIFGDVVDRYILHRSQAEMDKKIAEQLRFMLPEGGGGDGPEDPQYGIFGAAYLTNAAAWNIGLKSYDFTVTDAPCHSSISPTQLKRVFGDKVFDHVKENGFQMTESNLPTVEEVVKQLLERAHGFMILVDSWGGLSNHALSCWEPLYGKDRIVRVRNTTYLSEVQAAVIGLTEGTLSLDRIPDFLEEHATLPSGEAERIQEAVMHIPIGAQALLPNFDKIPVEGDLFAKKTDPWPVGHASDESSSDSDEEEGSDGTAWM